MIKKHPAGCFKWVKNVSKIDEEYIKNYDENSDIGYFLKVDIEYPKELHDLHSDTITIEDQIKDEKLQYDTNTEGAKISALSSGKIDKYEYLTGEEILPSNQQQIIEQAKFTYSPLGNAFEKQTKTIEDQGEKKNKSNLR